MARFFRTFAKREDGAVTVDWIVLTAAVVGLAVMIAIAMQDGTVSLGDKVAGFMSNWTF